MQATMWRLYAILGENTSQILGFHEQLPYCDILCQRHQALFDREGSVLVVSRLQEKGGQP